MSRILEVFSAYIDKLCESYTASPKALSIVRILFAIHVLVFPVDYKWVAEVPGAFFRPSPGPFAVFAEAPFIEVLVVLEIIRAAIALAVLVGFRTKTVSVALSVVMIIGSGFTHSFGKVDHFILYELLPAAMAFAGWGARYSLDSLGAPRFRHGSKRAGSTEGFPMLIWAITVGFALLTAAVPKVLTGWLDPFRQATRGYLARDLADPVKVGPLTEFLGDVQIDAFWKFLDYATILAEGCVIVAVLVPALFRISILLILGFHAGVYLALGIDFAHYLLVYAVFFAFPFRDWFSVRGLGVTRESRSQSHSGRSALPR